MTDTLYSYLLQHRNLPIPGLGTILIERAPAQSDFVNRQLLPPSFHFRFDKYFDAPDKEFFSYLAANSPMADYETIRWYNEWAYDLRNQIRTDHPVVLEGMGKLVKDSSGDISFLPFQALETYYGNASAERVVNRQAVHTVRMGDKEWKSDDAAEWLSGQKDAGNDYWYWYALILLAVAAVVLFFHFYRNGVGASATGLQRLLS
jgi:hypothetical protein